MLRLVGLIEQEGKHEAEGFRRTDKVDRQHRAVPCEQKVVLWPKVRVPETTCGDAVQKLAGVALLRQLLAADELTPCRLETANGVAHYGEHQGARRSTCCLNLRTLDCADGVERSTVQSRWGVEFGTSLGYGARGG